MIAINGASAALMLSGLPFDGPIGAVRLAYSQDGTWIPHPTYEEGDESTFEIVVAGRQVGDDVAIMMVEAGGTEKAWSYYEAGAPKVTEEVIAGGLEASKTWIRESIDLQNELVEQGRRAREPLVWDSQLDYGDDVAAAVDAVGRDRTGRGQHDRRQDRAQRRQRRAQGRDPRRADRRGQPVRGP